MALLDSVTTRSSLPVTALFHAGGRDHAAAFRHREAALAVSVTTVASASSVTLTVAVLVVVSSVQLPPAVELMLTVSAVLPST